MADGSISAAIALNQFGAQRRCFVQVNRGEREDRNLQTVLAKIVSRNRSRQIALVQNCKPGPAAWSAG